MSTEQTAKQYINARFASYIENIYESVLGQLSEHDRNILYIDEEYLMDDKQFTEALHFFHIEESDLKAMTLRERKQFIEQLRKQTNRLIYLLYPKWGDYPEIRY